MQHTLHRETIFQDFLRSICTELVQAALENFFVFFPECHRNQTAIRISFDSVSLSDTTLQLLLPENLLCTTFTVDKIIQKPNVDAYTTIVLVSHNDSSLHICATCCFFRVARSACLVHSCTLLIIILYYVNIVKISLCCSYICFDFYLNLCYTNSIYITYLDKTTPCMGSTRKENYNGSRYNLELYWQNKQRP